MPACVGRRRTSDPRRNREAELVWVRATRRKGRSRERAGKLQDCCLIYTSGFWILRGGHIQTTGIPAISARARRVWGPTASGVHDSPSHPRRGPRAVLEATWEWSAAAVLCTITKYLLLMSMCCPFICPDDGKRGEPYDALEAGAASAKCASAPELASDLLSGPPPIGSPFYPAPIAPLTMSLLAPSSPPRPFGVHNTNPTTPPRAPHMLKLHSNSILNTSPSSFSAFPPSPPASATSRNTSRPATPPLRAGVACSFADPTRAGSSLAGSSRPKLASAVASSGSSLLQRRSSASAAARPAMAMNLALPPVPPLPTDAIREHVIGVSAAADVVGSPTSDPGTPNGRVRSVVERAFQQVKSRRPTPFPEKSSFLNDEDEEAGDDEAEEELGDESVEAVEEDSP